MGWPADGQSTIRALLGPTNTGKTHRAIERLLEHGTGMIGLPLRLLAREVYDRMTAQVGEGAVALVTGEEKRIPPHPRYWVCTVEAMPEGREVDMVAIDEVQLAAHAERGHVFTDRVLHARGRRETWFMGADTIRPLLAQLVPTAILETRPRLSTLSAAGSLPMGSLPPRSAIVAFSAARVYEIAERMRAKRGGAAVVTGALSPRARNAQVALYQSGEVDYLVATDAIGMGLNMDVDLVAFADLRKFDGKRIRELEEAELAQIAGRAGRHHNDGRFATLAPLPPLAPSVTRAIERHRFPVLDRVYWRSRDLDFASPDALAASLRRAPKKPWLELMGDADDFRALLHLARSPDVQARARGAERVQLLWEVCQIPDYRQLQLDDHFHLLGAVFEQLTTGRGRLTAEWIRSHIERLDEVHGDIETLLGRMAAIRTWTYISSHAGWVEEGGRWQEKTRAIEDRLSDALHEQLVRRFVDARNKRGGRRAAALPGAPHSLAGQLRAKGLIAEGGVDGPARDDGWVDELADAPHDSFRADGSGRIYAAERLLGRLGPGVDLLRPDISVVVEEIGAGARLRLQRRLVAWARDLVADLLAPLRGEVVAALSPSGRGLVYQLEQTLGTTTAAEARAQLGSLTRADRRALEQAGVHLGRLVVYVRALLTPAALATRAVLCGARLGPGNRLEPPRPSAVSLVPDDALPDGVYTALGFPLFGPRALRADVAEAAAARAAHGAPAHELASRLGCPLAEVPAIRHAFERALGPRRVRR